MLLFTKAGVFCKQDRQFLSFLSSCYLTICCFVEECLDRWCISYQHKNIPILATLGCETLLPHIMFLPMRTPSLVSPL